MIERLVTTLSALAASSAPSLGDQTGRRLMAECADAVRLELDCPQQTLTRDQRASLRRLSDVLESHDVDTNEVVAAAQAASVSLGR
jgi:hypothetical protein